MLLLHRAALIVGLVMVAVGLLWFPPWEPQLTKYAVYALPRWLAMLLLCWWLARRLRWPLAATLCLALAVTLLHFHGLLVLAAIALMLLASIGVGSLLVAAADDPQAAGRSAVAVTVSRDRAVLAALVGGGMLAGATAWLLPWPIFSQTAMTAVLLLICVLRRDAILSHLRDARRELATAVREAPRASAATVAVLWLATLPAWLPVLSSDDLATHLQIGWQLQTLGYYRMDVGSQLWSLAPWLPDVGYGLLQLLAGSEGVGALNALWLSITAWLIVRLGQRLGLHGALPWLAAMLYVSLPIVASLTMSMQTETFSAMVVAALALVIVDARLPAEPRRLLWAAVLAAMLVGAKILNLAFLGPLGLLLLWQWRAKLPWRAVPAGLALALLVGGASYAYAWLLAGSPTLPLFNAVFESPWAPLENHADTRWHRGLSLATPFWLTFDAAGYYEVGLPRGTGGVALILLCGGWLLALADARLRPLALIGALAWLLPLTQIQYLRYTVPALPLLLPVALAGIAAVDWQRLLLLASGAAVALQLLLAPSASWILAAGGVRALSREGIDNLHADYAPERAIARYWREHRRPSDRLLFTLPDNASHAEYAGAAFVSSWYDPRVQSLVLSAADPVDGWRQAITLTGANYLLIHRDLSPAAVRQLLIEEGAQLEAAIGAAWLYRLPQDGKPGEPYVAPDGPMSIRFTVEPDSPRLLVVEVDLRCSQPFEPFAIGWMVGRQDRPTRFVHGNWLPCPADGRARVGIELALPAGSTHVDLDLRPVSETSEQHLQLVDQQAVDRRDLSRERELARRVRDATCWRWGICRRVDGPRVLATAD